MKRSALLLLALLALPVASRAEDSGRIPGSLEDVVEDGRAHAPRPTEERLKAYAEKASLLPSLPSPLAIVTTLAGAMMLLSGRRIFRVAVVVYFAALLGITGFETGRRMENPQPWLGAVIGCLSGAALSFPFRVLLRSIIGALTAGIVAFIVAQAYTDSNLATAATVGGALLAGGVVTFFFPTPLLIVGFAIFGAMTASVGIMSLATEPTDGHLAYKPLHILAVLGGAVIGAVIQAVVGISDEFGDDDGD